MDATKTHEAWESDVLHPSFETLLDQYRESIGSDISGVPAQLVQGASSIPEKQVSVVAAGPADCVAPELETEEGVTNHDLDLTASDQCAGIIDGGMDDFSPIQIWDAIMQKYRVAQTCREELHRLSSSKDEDRV